MRRLVLLAMFLSALTAASIPSAQTLPVITVTTNTPTVTEPDGFAEFVILKTPGPDVTVHFEMLGTAILGTDYMVIGDATSVTIPGGADAALVRIEVIDDFLVEPDKTITLHILADPTYTIGAADSATVNLRSEDPSSPPVPAVYVYLGPSPSQAFDPVIVAPNSQIYAHVYLGGLAVSVSLFVDSVKVASGKPVYTEFDDFTGTFAAPPPGLHVLTAVATTAGGLSGVSSVEFRVVDALVAPASTGYMTNANALTTGPVLTFLDGGTETAAGFVEIPVPAAATNWNAQLFITPSGGNAPNQLFTYRGDGTVTTNDYSEPAELVGQLEPLDPMSTDLQFQLDVTKWTQPAAGGYIGLKLRVDPSYAGNIPFTGVASSFNDIRLAFFSPTNDVPAQFDWLNFPTNHGHPSDQSLSMDLRLYDPDSHVKHIQVSDYRYIKPSYTNFTVGEVAVDLPPGTNFYSFPVTNLPVGSHNLTVRVTTDRGSVSHSYSTITVYQHEPGGPAHRWLGTDGDSSAFYVVDAAGRAWVWGNNSFGELGLGYKGGALTRPAMLPAPPGKKWRQFTSNSYCAAAVTDDGLLYGMGQNAASFTSVFTTPDPTTPSLLPFQNVFYIRRAGLTQSSLWVINESFTLVPFLGSGGQINSIRELETGGYNLIGIDQNGRMIGPNVGTNTLTPGAVLPWAAVSTCTTHSLALDSAGQLFGWGQNYAGQLPFAMSSSPIASPQKANFPAGVTNWTMIAAGKNVSLAVDSNGRLYSWGKAGFTGSTEPWVLSKIVLVTVPSNETGWLDLAVGSSFAIALSARGNLYVWGDIPGSPYPHHVALPELVNGLPDLLDANAAAGALAATFDPESIRLGAQELEGDIIAPDQMNLTFEFSADLVTWTTLTNTTSARGKTHFSAPVPASANLFLRVKP